MLELRAAAAKRGNPAISTPDEGVMTGVMVHHEVLPSVLGNYMRHRRLVCVTLSLPVILRRLPPVPLADGSAGPPRWTAMFDSDNFLARGSHRSVASTVDMVWVGMITQDCFDRVTDKEQPRRVSHTSQEADARLDAAEAEGSDDSRASAAADSIPATGRPPVGVSLGLADSLDREPGVEDLLPALSLPDRLSITDVLAKLNCVPIFLEDVASFEETIQAQSAAARGSPSQHPHGTPVVGPAGDAETPMSDITLTPAVPAPATAPEPRHTQKQGNAATEGHPLKAAAGHPERQDAPGLLVARPAPSPAPGAAGRPAAAEPGPALLDSVHRLFPSSPGGEVEESMSPLTGLSHMDTEGIGGTLDRVAGYRFTHAQPHPALPPSPEPGSPVSPGGNFQAEAGRVGLLYPDRQGGTGHPPPAAHAQASADSTAGQPPELGASSAPSQAAARAPPSSHAGPVGGRAGARGGGHARAHSRNDSDPPPFRMPSGPVDVCDASVAAAQRVIRRFAAYLGIVLGPNLHNVSEVGDLAALIDYGRIHARTTASNHSSRTSGAGSLPGSADTEAEECKGEEADKLRAGFGRLHVDEVLAVAERGWRAYRRVNQCFAHIIQQRVYRGGDVIWTHDYWLCLLPAYLAHLCRPTPSLIYFMHAPFPTSEIFRTLGNREELVRGLLAADVVGFHTFNHARHFLQVCKRVLGITFSSRNGGRVGLDVGGRDVSVTISHVGVDPDGLAALMASEEAAEHARAFRRQFPNKIVIAGLDTAGRLKGIALKLLAFERMLEHRRELAKAVVLVQLVETSALSLHGDQAVNMLELEQLRLRINRRHGPVVFVQQAVSFGPAHRVGLFHCADVLFQTPVREGLTLMPLEYIFVRTRWQLQRGTSAFLPGAAGASKDTLAGSDTDSTPLVATSGVEAPTEPAAPATVRAEATPSSASEARDDEHAQGAATSRAGGLPDSAAATAGQAVPVGTPASGYGPTPVGSTPASSTDTETGPRDPSLLLGGSRHLLQSANAEDVVDHMPRSYANIAAQTDLEIHRRQVAPPPRPAGVSGRLDPAVPEAANEDEDEEDEDEDEEEDQHKHKHGDGEEEEDRTALTEEERRARLYRMSSAATTGIAGSRYSRSGHHDSLGLDMSRHSGKGHHHHHTSSSSAATAHPALLGRAFSQPVPSRVMSVLREDGAGGRGAGRVHAGGVGAAVPGEWDTPTSADTDTSAVSPSGTSVTADASASDTDTGAGAASGFYYGAQEDDTEDELPVPLRHSESLPYLPRSEPLSDVYVPNVPNVDLLQAPLPPPDRSGCVVLSEFSTASHILNSTLRVNPYDVDQTARVLADAISMSDTDRSYRQWRDYRYTARNPAAHWSRRVLLELLTAEAAAAVGTAEFTELEFSQTTASADTRSTRLGAKGKAADCSHLMVDAVAESFRRASRRVLFVDYGGTLIAREGMGMYVKHEFVGQSRSARTLPPEVLADLATLASDPTSSLVLFVGLNISAGDAAALASITDLTIALENSAVVSWGRRDSGRLAPKVRSAPVGPEGVAVGVNLDSFADEDGLPRTWVRLGESADFLTGSLAAEWSEAVAVTREVMDTYRWRVNGSLLRESGVMLTWDYADADPEWGQRQANDLFTELRGLLRSPNISVDRRRTMVEVSPASVTKGTLAQRILECLSADEVAAGFALAVGDDSSDEDVFKSAHSFLLAATNFHEERQAASSEAAAGAEMRTRVYSVRVGRKHTGARYFLGNVNEVREMVAQLAAAV